MCQKCNLCCHSNIRDKLKSIERRIKIIEDSGHIAIVSSTINLPVRSDPLVDVTVNEILPSSLFFIVNTTYVISDGYYWTKVIELEQSPWVNPDGPRDGWTIIHFSVDNPFINPPMISNDFTILDNQIKKKDFRTFIADAAEIISKVNEAPPIDFK